MPSFPRVLASASPVLLAWAAFGCAGGGADIDLMPQTMTGDSGLEEVRGATVPPAVPAQEDPGPEASATPSVETVFLEESSEPADPVQANVVVIESGRASEDVTPGRLAAASRAERERRNRVEPVEIIDDKNLAEAAQGGQLTIATTPSGTTAAGQEAKVALDQQRTEEEFWRAKALQLRLEWKAAVEDVTRLEVEVESLRRRFYEEDDVYHRDGEIKPAWDRALEALTTARMRAAEAGRRVDELLDEGTRSGALPGWLREGIGYEPDVDQPGPARRRDDPREPQIVDEEAWEP